MPLSDVSGVSMPGDGSDASDGAGDARTNGEDALTGATDGDGRGRMS